MEKNPIVIIDDDRDDLELIRDAAEKLGIDRPIHYVENGEELREFLLNGPTPFLIICDVNLPGDDGFIIHKMMSEDPELHYKSVPFIFWSTSASEKQIQQAYDLPAQGFFFKPQQFNELCDTFRTIIDYWNKCQHPKRVV